MLQVPKLPVFGWSAFAGRRRATLPSVADIPNRRHTISGRASIELALRVLASPVGCRVLLPTYHCTTMVEPVIRAGLVPLFYPITASGAPYLAWLDQADLQGVQAMLVAHFFGIPQPMAALRAFCDGRGIALIEDCAHAYFGVSDGRPVGSWGDVAIASLTKFFPVLVGGMIVSKNRDLDTLDLAQPGWLFEAKAMSNIVEVGAQHSRFAGINGLLQLLFSAKAALRRLRRTGGKVLSARIDEQQSQSAREMLVSPDEFFAPLTSPWSVRCLVAAVHRERIVEVRRRNYTALVDALIDLPGTHLIAPDLPALSAPYVMPIYVADYESTYQRLRTSGIPIFCWDQQWPGIPSIPGDHGTDWARHVFQIGCHQDLSLSDIRDIATTLREVILNRQ